MRRSGDRISVVTGLGADPEAPMSFVWRGREYAVREVLGRWRERTTWWRAVVEGCGGESLRVEDLEEQVWRVVASPGRALTTGVYELGHARGWRLLRLSD